MTIRRWIESDKIPGPYLYDVLRPNVRLYSIGEVNVMLSVLSRREGFAYFTSSDPTAAAEMQENLHHYRSSHI